MDGIDLSARLSAKMRRVRRDFGSPDSGMLVLLYLSKRIATMNQAVRLTTRCPCWRCQSTLDKKIRSVGRQCTVPHCHKLDVLRISTRGIEDVLVRSERLVADAR